MTRPRQTTKLSLVGNQENSLYSYKDMMMVSERSLPVRTATSSQNDSLEKRMKRKQSPKCFLFLKKSSLLSQGRARSPKILEKKKLEWDIRLNSIRTEDEVELEKKRKDEEEKDKSVQ